MRDKISYGVVNQKSLEELYSQISNFKKNDAELMKKGDLEILDLNRDKYLEDGSVEKNLETDILSYKREYKGRSAIIVINRSNLNKSVKLPVQGKKGYIDYSHGKTYNPSGNKITLELKGYGYMILYRNVD